MENNKEEEEIKHANLTKNRKIDAPLIIALFAVLISFFSVILGYKETSILEEQQNLLFEQQGASAWPFLDNSTNFELNDNTAIFKYDVTNKGVGPAIVNDVTYTYKSMEIKNWGLALELEKAYPNLSIVQLQNANLNRRVLAPGDYFNVVTIRITATENFKGNLIDILVRISEEYKLTYCYCSVYGECWQVNGLNNLTKSSDCTIRSGLVN